MVACKNATFPDIAGINKPMNLFPQTPPLGKVNYEFFIRDTKVRDLIEGPPLEDKIAELNKEWSKVWGKDKLGKGVVITKDNCEEKKGYAKDKLVIVTHPETGEKYYLKSIADSYQAAMFTASFISFKVAMPVDIIRGFFVFAAYSIKGKSTNSKEAIL